MTTKQTKLTFIISAIINYIIIIQPLTTTLGGAIILKIKIAYGR